MNRVRLYKFTNGEPEYNQYVVSTLADPARIRDTWHVQDNGDVPWEKWEEVTRRGTMVEITSLDQIPESHHDYVPYETEELDEAENWQSCTACYPLVSWVFYINKCGLWPIPEGWGGDAR